MIAVLLNLFVGVCGASARLKVSLSDSSAAVVCDTLTGGSSCGVNRNYTILFKAGTANQTLDVEWTMLSGTNHTLQAAALRRGNLLPTAVKAPLREFTVKTSLTGALHRGAMIGIEEGKEK